MIIEESMKNLTQLLVWGVSDTGILLILKSSFIFVYQYCIQIYILHVKLLIFERSKTLITLALQLRSPNQKIKLVKSNQFAHRLVMHMHKCWDASLFMPSISSALIWSVQWTEKTALNFEPWHSYNRIHLMSGLDLAQVPQVGSCARLWMCKWDYGKWIIIWITH